MTDFINYLDEHWGNFVGREKLIALHRKLYSTREKVTAVAQGGQYGSYCCLWLPLGTINEEYLGSTNFQYAKLHFIEEYDAKQVNAFLQWVCPVEVCMHAYDCCGHFYCQGADVIGMQPYTNSAENAEKSREWIVCVKYTENV